MLRPPKFLQAEYRARPPAKSPAAHWGMYGPLVVTLLAFLSRVWRLGTIKTLVFDETYYVKDAYGLIKRGYEVQWPKDYDDIFISGHFTLPTEGSFVVHPSVGKWLIGLGIEVLGNNPWGWRIVVCLAGSAGVFLLGRIVWHLFGNGKMATLASAIIALDGVQIALSRTAILDILLEFFILLGVLFLVRDQLSYRPQLLAALADTDAWRHTLALETKRPDSGMAPHADTTKAANQSDWSDATKVTGQAKRSESPRRRRRNHAGIRRPSRLQLAFGPVFWWRPWLVAAGLAWGLATSVKWSGLYVVAVFGIFVFIRELSARWATEPRWISSSVLTGGIPAFVNLVPITAVVYVGSWLGWFWHPQGWGHTGGSPWRDWLEYHRQILNFHTTLVSDHPYKSNPWGWLLQLRPTSFYYQKVAGDCGTDQCIQSVTSLGNPLLWWLGFLAFIAVAVALVVLDWRAGLIVAGYFATYGPWLIYSNRTIFTFYTVVISPFVVLSLIYVLGVLWGQWRVIADKNWTGRYNLVSRPFQVSSMHLYLGVFIVALIALTAGFFFPIWTGMTIPQQQFYWRMWLHSWI